MNYFCAYIRQERTHLCLTLWDFQYGWKTLMGPCPNRRKLAICQWQRVNNRHICSFHQFGISVRHLCRRHTETKHLAKWLKTYLSSYYRWYFFNKLTFPPAGLMPLIEQNIAQVSNSFIRWMVTDPFCLQWTIRMNTRIGGPFSINNNLFLLFSSTKYKSSKQKLECNDWEVMLKVQGYDWKVMLNVQDYAWKAMLKVQGYKWNVKLGFTITSTMIMI